MKDQRVDILVPSMNNFQQLTEMINSIAPYQLLYPVRFIVINNGDPEMSEHPFFKHESIKVLTPGKNLGWEGALKLGLKESDSEFVMFANDDIYLPEASKHWISSLLQPFHNKEVGAVGPCSNVVMGQQNIFVQRPTQTTSSWYQVPYLIGFCMLLRRSALDAVGGVDDTLPGGDDIDLSIRLNEGDYRMVLDASTFVWHHGFQTGTRVHGSHTKPGGWNSPEMTERTNNALIRKHGLRKWYECLYGSFAPEIMHDPTDYEGDVVRKHVAGDNVVELGCGGRKTVPNAVGVDRVVKGETIPVLKDFTSVADVVADVTKTLPFEDGEFDCLIARHILEHCQDTVTVLKEWSRIVKAGGRLIIAVPDQSSSNTIPMNPEHLVSFTPDSLQSIAELIGLKELSREQGYNDVSFTAVYEKQ